MPATFTPIQDDVVAGVRNGDEKALERLFREHFDALVDEAAIVLGDATHAPKAVEGAMLRAWGRRAEFTTPSALEEFLHQSVHEAAVRDKARRAGLHKHDARGAAKNPNGRAQGPISVDEAWGHVTAAIHAPVPDARSAAAAVEAHRHVAAEHMAHVVKQRSPLVTLAYGGAIIAAVAGLLFFLFRDTPEKKVGRALASDKSSEIMSKYGQIGSTTLDDGSKVTIGADSKLRIPPGFNKEVRAIGIQGTASFEVAAGNSLPFEVRIANVAVIATGTKFAVAYDTATKTVFTKVTEGTVNVRVGEVITPVATGKALAVDASGAAREPSQPELDEALAWMEQRFVINQRTLRLALAETRRWYGMALVPSDMSLMDRKVSVDAPLGASKEMIADLEQSGNLKFGWDDKTMMLYDAGKPIPEKKK